MSKLTFQAASTGKPMNCRSWLPWCWVACHSFDLSPKTSDNYALLKLSKLQIFSNLGSQFWIIFWISDLQHCPCFILANFKLWKFDIWPHLRSRNFNFGQKLLILDFDKKCLDLDYCTKYINSLSWKHCGKYFVEL